MVNRLFLVGYMGCGKTTIGKFVARDMNWKFIDMDAYFEEKHACTITEFFAKHGERGFREAERMVVAELAKAEEAVIACGGGAPCFFDNMRTMNASGATIYINVAPAELAARLKSAKANRPLLAKKTDEELLSHITAQLAEREKFYRQAHMIVDGVALPMQAYRTLVEMFPEENLKLEK